ncbi:MAG: toll/interleukin-1 receptor domain-containing protein [Polyangiaceae bacterium]
MDPPASPSQAAFDAERTWRGIRQVLDFGDRLDFVFLQFADPTVFEAWRFALRAWAREQGLRWSEPAAADSILDWLEGERRRGVSLEQSGQAERPREVYLGVIPQSDDEGTLFARINENRDNLVRALNGTLCLCGSGDFVRRLAYAAPSIWAMRTRSFDLVGPPPASAPASAAATHLESLGATLSMRRSTVTEAFDLDAFISASPRDEREARSLADRLTGEGLSVRVGTGGKDHEAMERARFVVVLLSREYVYSKAWEAVQNSRLAREQPESLKQRFVPILFGDAAIPGLLRDSTPLDFRTPESRARDTERLLLRLRGERERSAGPGLAPAPPVLSTDTGWLDKVPLDFSHPSVRELLNVLISAYPYVDSVKRIARSAAIPLDHIRTEEGISTQWHDLLEQAAVKSRLRPLMDILLRDPDTEGHHPALRRIAGHT